MKRTLLVIFLLILSGCQTTYSARSGLLYPDLANSTGVDLKVGVVTSDQSEITRSSIANRTRLSITDVSETFANRLRDNKIFDVVVFPYSEHSYFNPDIVLVLKTTIIEDENFAENMTKAVAHGASFFVLKPFLPIKFGIDVKLEVTAHNVDGEIINKYSYEDLYELSYNTLIPNSEKYKEWPEKAKLHAIDNIIRIILEDRENIIEFNPTDNIISAAHQ